MTLVELLVVIAIVGLLVALTIPAIQAAREASRGLSCRNNLKQIATAFQHHESQCGFFPSGGVDFWSPPTFIDGNPATGSHQEAGWGFQILPFIEAKAIWHGGSGHNETERITQSIGATQPLFFCPSRRGPQTITYSDPAYMGGLKLTHALCDYAGSNLENTGLVRRYRPIAGRQVVDGLSKTLTIADKRLNLRHLGEWQEDDNEGYTSGWDEDTMRRTDVPPAVDYIGDRDGGELFGASHPTVFNAAFADGSVRGIRYDVSPDVFRYLGRTDDHQTNAESGD